MGVHVRGGKGGGRKGYVRGVRRQGEGMGMDERVDIYRTDLMVRSPSIVGKKDYLIFLFLPFSTL